MEQSCAFWNAKCVANSEFMCSRRRCSRGQSRSYEKVINYLLFKFKVVFIKLLSMKNFRRVILMETDETRQELLHEFAQRSKEFVKTSVEWAPDTVQSHLQVKFGFYSVISCVELRSIALAFAELHCAEMR